MITRPFAVHGLFVSRRGSGPPGLVLALLMLASASALGPAFAAPYRLADATVAVREDAPPMVKLAANELRGYIQRLTGIFPRLANEVPPGRPAIRLETGASDHLEATGADPKQNFALWADGATQVVQGATDYATLWGAYHLVQSWGVGFYLGGDALPKQDPALQVELVEAQCHPALAIRGNLPWFNFQNSPTTWNPQDYKTFFAQMAKQKANFIGFHAYDHEPFGAYAVTKSGAKMGGPLMTTISAHRWWSPHAMCTKDFLFGTDLFFDRGEWGCEVGIEEAWTFAPGRSTQLQQRMMAEALAYAHTLGIKTCLGWEVTGDPEDAATREAFRRRLAHTLATYPLDYFWIWQSEGRGVGGNKEGTPPEADITQAFAYLGQNHDLTEAARITRFVRLAHATLKEMAPQVRLIVSGWGGDKWMRFSSLYQGLDKAVPADVIFSALDNIDPRLEPNVASVYGTVAPTRERWPVPWFESDGGFSQIDQTGPQANVVSFEPVLQDIVRKQCQGALGIHWRTRNVEEVAGYLYRFAWDPKLTAAEFYRQYARDHYGPADADRMAKVHLRLEELGPNYVGAAGCVECSTPFSWFVKSVPADQEYKPNRGGNLPQPQRFLELERLASELQEQGAATDREGRRDAAIRYRDLGRTIHWLVVRAKVGLAIWNNSAPLERRLKDAERLAERGRFSEAGPLATQVLSDLEAYHFREAFQALAETCRTRGELGMLATANERYGRFYAAFVQRIAQVLRKPLPASRGPERWSGAPLFTVFPVPNQIGADQTVSFDAVLLPRGRGRIELSPLGGSSPDKVALGLERLGGAYHRAVFFPPDQGAWAWRLVLENAPAVPDLTLPSGVLMVGPAAGKVQPASQPVRQPETVGQKAPVLKLDFEAPLSESAEAMGAATRTEGVHGQALDLRQGGFLRLKDKSAAVAFTGPFSIVFFARPEPWDGTKEMPVLLCKGRFDGNGYLVQLFQGQVRVCFGQTRCLDAGTLAPNQWTHVAVVYDGAEARLFLNGREVGSAEIEEPIATSPLPLRIGVYDEPGGFQVSPFRGCLDELAFYNRPLSPQEITDLARR